MSLTVKTKISFRPTLKLKNSLNSGNVCYHPGGTSNLTLSLYKNMKLK